MASDSGSRRAASGGAALRRMMAAISAPMRASASSREYRVDLRIEGAVHFVVMHQSVSTLSGDRGQRGGVLFGDCEGVNLAAVGGVSRAWRKNAELSAADRAIDGEAPASRAGLHRMVL